jgi:hypothetical protein
MRLTATRQPHGRGQTWKPISINVDVPSGLCLLDHQQLNGATAATWTLHAYRPILTVIPRQNEVTKGHFGRQGIAFHNYQPASWAEAVNPSTKPLSYRPEQIHF